MKVLKEGRCAWNVSSSSSDLPVLVERTLGKSALEWMLEGCSMRSLLEQGRTGGRLVIMSEYAGEA